MLNMNSARASWLQGCTSLLCRISVENISYIWRWMLFVVCMASRLKQDFAIWSIWTNFKMAARLCQIRVKTTQGGSSLLILITCEQQFWSHLPLFKTPDLIETKSSDQDQITLKNLRPKTRSTAQITTSRSCVGRNCTFPLVEGGFDGKSVCKTIISLRLKSSAAQQSLHP